MHNTIVLFPKLNDAKSIRNLLVRHGIDVTMVCTSAGQVIHRLDDLERGLIICGYKYPDMMYHELRLCIPKAFEMLVVTSKSHREEVLYDKIPCVTMPVKVYEFLEEVNVLLNRILKEEAQIKRRNRQRTPEEMRIIEEAKSLIMQNNRMTEKEAHSYLQKRSMDSGVNLVEMAQIVLSSY